MQLKPVIVVFVISSVLSLPASAQDRISADLGLLKQNYSFQGLSLGSIKAELEAPTIKVNRYKSEIDGKQGKDIPARVFLPKVWSYEDLAVFCKLEVKLEQTIKLPVKFRLGEVNYAEMREGKPHSLIFY